MGQSKREWERRQAEGWSSQGCKFVCAECIEDGAIKRYIIKSATHSKCSYCNACGANICVELDDLLSFIGKGINRHYEDPANEVPYDSGEGGYLIEPTDGWDLICGLGITENNELFDDLSSAFCGNHYVPKKPLSPREHERLRYSWEGFCRQIKHHARFVFCLIKPTEFNDYHEEEFSSPYQILEFAGRYVAESGWIKTIPETTTLFRARHDSKVFRLVMEELGTPPEKFAGQNRMSPAGIAMFYAAEDIETAMKEIQCPDATKPHLAMAEFRPARQLRILDLTNAPNVPGIFDECVPQIREEAIFMGRFLRDLQAEVKPDEQHYEYVPTQVVSEYFRHVFKCSDGRSLDGIRYPSVQKADGICIVLFFNQRALIPPEWAKTESPLTLIKAEWISVSREAEIAFAKTRQRLLSAIHGFVDDYAQEVRLSAIRCGSSLKGTVFGHTLEGHDLALEYEFRTQSAFYDDQTVHLSVRIGHKSWQPKVTIWSNHGTVEDFMTSELHDPLKNKIRACLNKSGRK